MKNWHLGHMALLFTAALFGLAFIFQRHAAGLLSALHFMAWRFALSALFLALCVAVLHLARAKTSYGAWWRDGTICGGLMFLGMISQQWGIAHTTAGKSGFITGLYVVIVPLIGLFLGRKLSKTLFLALILAVSGLICFSGIQSNERALQWNIGDVATLFSAVAWAAYVCFIEYAVRRSDTLAIATMQSTVVAGLSIIGMGLTDGLALLGDGEKFALTWGDVLFTSIASSAIAFFLQAWGQKTVPATHAAIILSLESVFALLFGALLLHETVTERMLLGCGLLLSAMLIAQCDET